MKAIDVVATSLIVVGALNWGLVGTAHFDLVAALAGLTFGETNALTSSIYLLVALSGLYQAVTGFSQRAIPARA